MARAASVLALVGTLLIGGAAHAASMSYFLNQSNDPEGWLPDGTNYLQVTIADGVGGDIDVTVDLLAPLTSIAGANFGIQAFLFNSTNVLSAANIVGVPAGWGVSTDYNPAAPHLTGDGFGRFEIELADGGMFRQAPTLSFTISIAGDSIADYAVLATNGGQGPTFFGAHVAGFVDQDPLDPLDPIDIGNPGIGQCYDTTGMGDYTPGCNILTSGWFGGTTVVPEPATASLLGLSLCVLAWMRRRSAV
jgi:hypothetical protein